MPQQPFAARASASSRVPTDDSCVYRILSFTNYHPGLIQVFCYHLLERLYAKNPVFPIPHKPLPITKEDVDSIYMQEEVRDGIRERFEWTLALDQRYQVITWAMIVAQAQDRDSFGREFSVAELFGLTREYWLAEFETMTNDEFRGLLQELSGLGVLIKGQGKYRLKSPNLVRLLGTEEGILNRLYEFVDKPARVEAEPDGFHHLINAKGQVYSAFTFEQARNIDLRNDFRVVIVSQALGFEHIEESIKSLYSDQKKTGVRRVKVGVDGCIDEQVYREGVRSGQKQTTTTLFCIRSWTKSRPIRLKPSVRQGVLSAECKQQNQTVSPSSLSSIPQSIGMRYVWF